MLTRYLIAELPRKLLTLYVDGSGTKRIPVANSMLE